MFRTKEPDPSPWSLVAFSAVLGLQVAALAADLAIALALGGPDGPSALAWGARLPVGLALAAAIAQALCLVAFVRLGGRHRASQQSIHRVKLLAHDILASMDQGVVTADQQGVVTSINSAASRLLGVDFECVGRPLASISSEPIPLDELARRVAEGHAAIRDRELDVRRQGGRQRLLVNVHELKDGRGHTLGTVTHVRDVTERMLMKEQMWRMEQFASLSTLASGLHHEIKNPLTALSIHVQLLEEHLRDLDPGAEACAMIGVLKDEIRRLHGILESFRDFASLQRLDTRPTAVWDVLEGVARLILPQATRQGVRLMMVRPGEDLPKVEIDPEKLEQAVLNLVINALDVMPSGGELTLAAGVDDGALRVEVGDTGPGIAPGIREHVFRPYFSTKSRGTGMGLALAEKLVRQHGGQVDFRTGPAGTTFRIAVPLAGRDADADAVAGAAT
jgi:PAS domain S-box-containing protein